MMTQNPTETHNVSGSYLQSGTKTGTQTTPTKNGNIEHNYDLKIKNRNETTKRAQQKRFFFSSQEKVSCFSADTGPLAVTVTVIKKHQFEGITQRKAQAPPTVFG